MPRGVRSCDGGWQEFLHASPSLDLVGVWHRVGYSGYMADYTADLEVIHHRESVHERSQHGCRR